MTTTTSTARTYTTDAGLPRLVIPSPSCSHCDNDVEYDGDGGAVCSTCRVYWPSVGEDETSEPLDEEDGVCGLAAKIPTRSPYNHGGSHWEFGPFQPCALPSGHGGQCRHSYTVTTTILTETEATR